MKNLWPIFLLFSFCAVQAQYLFEGQVSDDFRNQPVYLSLVEDYRKASRIYLDQIIQKTDADSLGHFKFEGDFILEENRVYRIHTDSCSDMEAAKNHFLRECGSSEKLLFIANGRDTISLPLGNQEQAFCEIISTNLYSAKILEAELLKETMVLDLIEAHSETSKSLNLDKWFKRLQNFGIAANEPLVELYCYNFLSGRSSETYEHYLYDVASNDYYQALLDRLEASYKSASFTEQYRNEISADKNLSESSAVASTGFEFKPEFLLYALAFVGMIFLFLIYRKREKSKKYFSLTQREEKIYEAIRTGKTNKEIASELFISLSTVKTHINNIYKKLGISSRDELR